MGGIWGKPPLRGKRAATPGCKGADRGPGTAWRSLGRRAGSATKKGVRGRSAQARPQPHCQGLLISTAAPTT